MTLSTNTSTWKRLRWVSTEASQCKLALKCDLHRMHENTTDIFWNPKKVHERVHNAITTRSKRTRNNSCWNSDPCTFRNSTTVSIPIYWFEANFAKNRSIAETQSTSPIQTSLIQNVFRRNKRLYVTNPPSCLLATVRYRSGIKLWIFNYVIELYD